MYCVGIRFNDDNIAAAYLYSCLQNSLAPARCVTEMPGCFCGCFFQFFSQLTRPLGSLSIFFSKPFFICRRFVYDLVIHFDEFNFVTAFDATTLSQCLWNCHLPPISDFPFVFILFSYCCRCL
ncbi:hypothetical protein C463_17463 [Halorubrum californiense DSM 19288]|uniref:Uncharacterized protein n=1 Tax=Halorubrum californiense DSM 19288 TaxID=1227465 RepID=M0DUN0_9EURY|nr:hypothetical protein C463_17463 [Halorubrum californiense DSM 19288]